MHIEEWSHWRQMEKTLYILEFTEGSAIFPSVRFPFTRRGYVLNMLMEQLYA